MKVFRKIEIWQTCTLLSLDVEVDLSGFKWFLSLYLEMIK